MTLPLGTLRKAAAIWTRWSRQSADKRREDTEKGRARLKMWINGERKFSREELNKMARLLTQNESGGR